MVETIDRTFGRGVEEWLQGMKKGERYKDEKAEK